jgi:molybdopterin converting factor small subunit
VNLRIKLIGFPDLKRLIGSNEIEVPLEGATFGDLLRQLEYTYGAPVRKALLNEKGGVDGSVQVLLNDREWISREDLSLALTDGDRVTFLLMVAGG